MTKRSKHGVRTNNRNQDDLLPRLPRVEALLDLARAHIPRKELGHLVMNDPGVYGYIAAYEAVLARGVPALFEIVEGLPRINGFDIHENLLVAHLDAGESVTHRWFSVLASCIEIFRDPYGDAFGWPPYSHRIKELLVDSYAMAAAGISRPLELLPAVFQEQERSIIWDQEEHSRLTCNQSARALAMVCELLTRRPLSDKRAETICHELLALHEGFQQEWLDDDEEYCNPCFAKHPAFIWGSVLGVDFRILKPNEFRNELRVWLDLVQEHFPSSPALVADIRERLLRDGSEWLSESG